MDLTGIIIGVGLFIVANIVQKWINDKPNPKTATEIQYKAKLLLSKYEWKNYMSMREYAAKRDLIICPKVRLADLIEPEKETDPKAWRKAFNRISSKHVDFVLCDPGMHVHLIVELDDYSHFRQDRQDRDAFVDAALLGAGYKVLHIYKFNDAAVEAFNRALGINTPEATATQPTANEY